MQPEPAEVPQQLSSDNTAHNSSHEDQHGLQHVSQQGSSPILQGDEGGVPALPSDAFDIDSVSSSGSERHDNDAHLGRMSRASRSRKPISNVSRIDEYERLHSSPPRRSELGFTVVKSGRKDTAGIPIEEFPNEVLTHILSHLPPSSLAAMNMVSRRFHNLVTTPHAWRIAFSRFFPGPDAIKDVSRDTVPKKDSQEILKSDKRSFSRLSALASWRSEYILRTRLLRSLARGRPLPFQSIPRGSSARSVATSQSTAVITYSSNLLYPVSHIHATFGVGLNKKQPLFMHGASEQGVVTISDPSLGKIGNWGLSDNQNFMHFADLFPGDAAFGLGSGDMIGMPNVMDVSQPYGKVYGEACPGGRVFFTSVSEQRGRFLQTESSAQPELGIPNVTMLNASISAVWIAKSEAVLKLSNGIVGMFSGYSNGILAAHSIGSSPIYDGRFEKGELTAKWVLSPGVPIVAISVDDKLSSHRCAHRRMWAVVLNALGEVFYLCDLPSRPGQVGKVSADQADRLAWKCGRSVPWTLVESTRREAKSDPFDTEIVDGSYTPRSSCDSAGLSTEQIVAETKEIEKFLLLRPKHFQKVCEGWDMERRLIVDFAGDDRQGAGESILIVRPGLQEGCSASIRRFTRRLIRYSFESAGLEAYPPIQTPSQRSSLFGGPAAKRLDDPTTPSPISTPRSRASSHEESHDAVYSTEWHLSDLAFSGMRSIHASAVTMDESTFAQLLTSEDPILGMSGGSSASSPYSSPLGGMQQPSTPSEIPGQRARFVSVGTTTGVVFVWDIRGPLSNASDIINSLPPVRIIYTDSPQISCLAMTSLYLVHGGNDGLVQAWDVLLSSSQPIRTLNSRFSSRARRRLIQAEASVHGVGNNYYAAGAICLDSDPTSLRGIVSLGTHLRYWSYSSSAAEQYKGSKRRLRRSERGSNSSPQEQRFSHTGRGALKDYIANEKMELEREKAARRKEDELLRGRFGVDLLGPGASDEDLLSYAQMLSEESYTSDEVKRRGSANSEVATSASSETVPAHDLSLSLADESSSSSPMYEKHEDELDAEVVEAIRLSLGDQSETAENQTADLADIPIRYAKNKWSLSSSPRVTSSSSKDRASEQEANDLEFAMQLSLAEEQSRMSRLVEEEEFPALGSGHGTPSGARGKGKRRAS